MLWHRGALLVVGVFLTTATLVSLGVRGAARPARAADACGDAPAPPALPTLSTPPTVGSPDGGGFLGVILPRRSIDVAARYAGRLGEVHVRIGDDVPAGGRVATLDVPAARFDLAIAVAQAQAAEVEAARAAVELAEADERLGRQRALFAEALVTGEDLAGARYQQQFASLRLDAARAQLRERRTRADQLRQAAEDAEIRAPFAGVVAARYLDPGINVTADMPIVRIIDARDLLVRFAVPEGAPLRVGDRVRVRLREPQGAFDAVVEKIAPEVDAAARLVVVEAGLGDAAAAAHSGEMAQVFSTRGAAR